MSFTIGSMQKIGNGWLVRGYSEGQIHSVELCMDNDELIACIADQKWPRKKQYGIPIKD